MRQAKPHVVRRLLNILRGQHAQKLETRAPALIKLLHSSQVQYLHALHIMLLACSIQAMQHVSTAHWSAQRMNEVTPLSNLFLQVARTGSAVAGSIPAWAWQTSLLTFAAVGLLEAHADMDEERLSPGRVDLTLLQHLDVWSRIAASLAVLLLDLARLNCSTS